jgi:hypothetical protein
MPNQNFANFGGSANSFGSRYSFLGKAPLEFKYSNLERNLHA